MVYDTIKKKNDEFYMYTYIYGFICRFINIYKNQNKQYTTRKT